jgi:hypothetical protein
MGSDPGTKQIHQRIKADLPQEVATDEVCRANQSHVFDSTVPGEGREPEQPGQTENTPSNGTQGPRGRVGTE